MLSRFSRFLFASCIFFAGETAFAGVLASGSITIDGTESLTGTLRVTRDGVSSTFATPKAFPGTNTCPGGTCFFRTVTVTPADPSVTVTLTNPDVHIFAVAYLNSFNPASLSTNYLGDSGVSGTSSFQVTVPAGQSLVLTFVNAGGLGTAQFQISDPSIPATPIPSTLLLSGIGMLMLIGWSVAARNRMRVWAGRSV